jgi:hemolysin activation/secretion protein
MKRFGIWGVSSLFSAILGAQPVPLSSHSNDPSHVTGVASKFPEIRGVTVYDAQQLVRFASAKLAASGQSVTARAMAQIISQKYRADGFLLAEVLAQPDATRTTWVIQVNEGWISEIQVTGVEPALASRMQDYFLDLRNQQPAQSETLERSLALAGDLAGVSVQSALQPDPNTAGSMLTVQATQVRGDGGVYLDLVPMRPGYARRLSIQQERFGLLQPGDRLRLNVMTTREPHAARSVTGSVFYRTSWGRGGNYAEVNLGNSRSERNLGSLPLNAETHGVNSSIALGHPVRRNLHEYVYVLGVLDHAYAKSRLGLDEPRSEATALRAYLVGGESRPSGNFRQGWITLSAGQRPTTQAGYADDGKQHFWHLRAGAGVSGPWKLGDSVMGYRLEAASQWTTHAVPSIERFFLGHYPYLRGYVPGEVSGDRGLAFTSELTRRGSISAGLNAWVPFAFLAGGHVQTLALAGGTGSSWTLASAGAGLRTPLGERASMEFWTAVPLKDGPVSRSGDWAAYLSLGWRW